MNSDFRIVDCEQLNVNDSSYKLIELPFKNGDTIKKGDVVMILDSSKAAYDIHTGFEGIFYTAHNINDLVDTNEPLFIVLNTYDVKNTETYNAVFSNKEVKKNIGERTSTLNNKTITEKAKKIISEYKIDIAIFSETLITEKIVNNYLQKNLSQSRVVLDNPNYNQRKRIAIIAGGKGFVQLLDIIAACNIVPVFIYDDAIEKVGTSIYNVPVKGKIDYNLIKRDFENKLFEVAIIATSTSISFRKNVFTELTNLGIPFCNLIHPTAYIGFDCIIGTGNIILPFVSVGPCTVIGDNNFISAHSNIEHHNYLGSHCTFGPGVMTSGSVTIEDEVKFGTGIFIEPRLSIGHNSIICSGSIITKSIPINTVAFSKQSDLTYKPNMK